MTPAWTWAVVGAGLMNLLPGATTVALAGTEPAGVVPWWQDSQAVPDGTWASGPAGLVGGITVSRLTPANDEPVSAGP